MAEMYLGPTVSSAVLLPPIRGRGGLPQPSFDRSKPIEKANMSDGAVRYNFKSHSPRRWSFEWQMLTAAEFAIFETAHGYNSALYFQNNWEDAVWRTVVITSYMPDPVIDICGDADIHYNLKLSLEEVI